jgi:hypothetical protein
MYWFLILFIVFLLLFVIQPKRENFQEMFGFSGYKKPVTGADTFLDYSAGNPDMTKFTEVTAKDGITSDTVNENIQIIQNFLKTKFNFCVYPIETSKISKLKHNETDSVIYRCRFMFMVTSSTYPFVIGLDVDVLDGKVIRAVTQDMYKGQAPSKDLEENFLPFQEIESFNVYTR